MAKLQTWAATNVVFYKNAQLKFMLLRVRPDDQLA